jgi:hypothetical protein
MLGEENKPPTAPFFDAGQETPTRLSQRARTREWIELSEDDKAAPS